MIVGSVLVSSFLAIEERAQCHLRAEQMSGSSASSSGGFVSAAEVKKQGTKRKAEQQVFSCRCSLLTELLCSTSIRQSRLCARIRANSTSLVSRSALCLPFQARFSAVVTEFGAAKATRGTDYCTVLTLKDESCGEQGNLLLRTVCTRQLCRQGLVLEHLRQTSQAAYHHQARRPVSRAQSRCKGLEPLLHSICLQVNFYDNKVNGKMSMAVKKDHPAWVCINGTPGGVHAFRC